MSGSAASGSTILGPVADTTLAQMRRDYLVGADGDVRSQMSVSLSFGRTLSRIEYVFSDYFSLVWRSSRRLTATSSITMLTNLFQLSQTDWCAPVGCDADVTSLWV